MFINLASLFLTLFLLKCANTECGVRKLDHRPLVTHGYETEPGSYPWHVAIYHREAQGISYKCGGTIISEDTVLTAAHCAFDPLGRIIIPQRMVLHFGKHNLLNLDTKTVEFPASSIEIHPNFDSTRLSNDIAKVKLAGELSFNTYIQPICLWDSNRQSISEVENKIGTVVGWGFTEKDKTSDILREATMPVVPFATCLDSNRLFFGHFLSDSTFCAGYRNGTSVCNGDSGGGMYFEENGVWKLRGIVSISTSRENSTLCNTKDYVIFTDVAYYSSWIVRPRSFLSCPTQDYNKDRGQNFPWDASLCHIANTCCCSATLISAYAVLALARCECLKYNPAILKVEMVLRRKASNINIVYNVSSVSIHGRYNRTTGENDLAIVRLKQEVEFGTHVEPVCIPSLTTPRQNEALYIYGSNYTSLALVIFKVETEDYSKCLSNFGDDMDKLWSNDTLCTKMNDPFRTFAIRPPLLAFNGVRWYMIGLLNGRMTRGSHFLFTGISKYVPWILETLETNSTGCIKENHTSMSDGDEITNFPWEASICHIANTCCCSATLISANAVLALARCECLKYDPIILNVEMVLRKKMTTSTIIYRVSRITLHDNYNRATGENDLAIVHLRGVVQFGNNVRPICIPGSSTLTSNEALYTYGSNYNSLALVISKVDLQNFTNCQSNIGKEMNGDIFNSTLCTKISDPSISFAIRPPLLAFNGTDWYMRGILNNKMTSSPYYVFTEIQKFVPWILETLEPNFIVCGKRKVPKSETEIVNRGEFPWHAMIYYNRNRDLEFACGGTLITKNVVITVATCFYYPNNTLRNTNNFRARFGVQNLHQMNSNSEEIPIFRIIMHADPLFNDIGLAVLGNDVTFSDYIQPACLWDSSEETRMGSIISWGKQIYEGALGPERISIPIVSEIECLQSRSSSETTLNHKLYFCGGFLNDSLSSCRSDIGVGLVVEIEGTAFLKGLLTWNIDDNSTTNCHRYKYDTFVDLKSYLPWIKRELSLI